MLNKYRNVVYEVTDALQNLFSSSLKSPVTDFGYSLFAVLRQNVHHCCCPLVLVPLAVPEDMFLRLQPITTFDMKIS
jgi:hypothetical protein